jgi:hypothetical protein
MFGDHLPVGPHRPGLAPVFGSRSRVVSSTGVQAFSEAHGGCGTIRTVTQLLSASGHLLDNLHSCTPAQHARHRGPGEARFGLRVGTRQNS